jgi:hypothetical protein
MKIFFDKIVTQSNAGREEVESGKMDIVLFESKSCEPAAAKISTTFQKSLG